MQKISRKKIQDHLIIEDSTKFFIKNFNLKEKLK